MNNVQFHSDLDRLIEILPPRVTKHMTYENMEDVIEIVLDMGRCIEGYVKCYKKFLKKGECLCTLL